MRKELDNSYLAEVNKNGKFLGKNTLNVHGGNNNTVSNVLSTIDGGVTLGWNDKSLISVTGAGYESGPLVKDRIVPAGSIVVKGGFTGFTFASFQYYVEDYYIVIAPKGYDDTPIMPINIVGVLATDVDFGNFNEVSNVAVVKCADVYVDKFVESINSLDFKTPQSSRDEILGSIKNLYKGSDYHVSLAGNGRWFDYLNLNIK